MERHQQAIPYYNVKENQENILDNSNMSSKESKNTEDNLMVNISLLHGTLEEPKPLPQNRQKRKRTKGPIT